MSEVYCVYSDREFPASETTPEHIIPLALGGKNGFTIPVQRTFNAGLGHTIDAAIANDPILKMKRAKLDLRGHNSWPVKARWTKTIDQNGNPLQVEIDKKGLRVRDPKTKRYLSNSETSSLVLSSNLKIDVMARMPFSAKVALGTGYFLFGDTFRNYADHHELRDVIRPIDAISEEILRANKLHYLDPIFDPKKDRADVRHKAIELVLRSLGCAGVVFTRGPGRLFFSIGLLGEWFSTVTVPADDYAFPHEDDFDLGHVVVLKPGGLGRFSFLEAGKRMQKLLNKKQD